MHQPQPAGSAQDSGQLVHGRGGAARDREVVPGGERMAGVQAHPRARVPVEHVQVGPQVRQGGAEQLALPGHRLQQQAGAIGRDRVQHRQQALPRIPHALAAVPAGRRAGVHDDAAGPDRPAPAQRVPHRGHGAFADHRVRGAHVDQVRRADDDRQPGPGQLIPDHLYLTRQVRRVAGGQGPGARVGHEHLERLGADVGRVTQPGRQAAGHRDVRPHPGPSRGAGRSASGRSEVRVRHVSRGRTGRRSCRPCTPG